VPGPSWKIEWEGLFFEYSGFFLKNSDKTGFFLLNYEKMEKNLGYQGSRQRRLAGA
jgi:hypothetical protein